MRRAMVFLGLASLTGCLTVPGPDGSAPDGPAAQVAPEWREVATNYPEGQLYGVRLVYHPSLGRVVAFGGGTGSMARGSGTLYQWDGAAWSVLDDGPGPGPRIGHGMTYDAGRGALLLYGGLDLAGTAREDVWTWRDGVWRELATAGDRPGPRAMHYLGYDERRGRVVLFGGSADGGVVPADDVVYELTGADWTAVPAPIPHPEARIDPGGHMPYDPDPGEVLIYGGDAGGDSYRDDLWGWDGAAWRRRCADCTGTAREAAGVGFDRLRRRTIIATGWAPGELEGTVEIHDGLVARTVGGPSARDTGSLVFDDGRGVAVFLGGNGPGCDGYCQDTLEYADP